MRNFTAEARRNGERPISPRRHGDTEKIRAERKEIRSACIAPATQASGHDFSRTVQRSPTARFFSASPRFRGEKFSGFWKTLRATLREIFDESAYDRFLRRTSFPPSRESYRAFMREKEAGISQSPKCC